MSTSITISKQIEIQDEGVLRTSDVNSIDFTGAGITATNVGNDVTVNVPGGGGGVHVLTKPVTGRSYGVRTNATTANSSSSVSANNISLYPFIPANSITISNLQLNVAGTAAANIRILVYSDLNGVPSSKLIESTNLDPSTIGVKTFTTSYTFTAGTVYWLGCYSSASVSVSVLDAAQMTPISTNAFGTAYSSVFASATFGSAPSTLGTATLSSSTSNLCAINLTAA